MIIKNKSWKWNIKCKSVNIWLLIIENSGLVNLLEERWRLIESSAIKLSREEKRGA